MQFPKPGRKRKGRGQGTRRDPAVKRSAQHRDGGCLLGLFLEEAHKCLPGYVAHHIKTFGRDPRNDVLENLICVCNYHHRRAQEYFIPEITQQGALYHFYGYGPPEHITNLLDAIKWAAHEVGYRAEFYLMPGGVSCKFMSTLRRRKKDYTWEQTEMMERDVFLRDIKIFLSR